MEILNSQSTKVGEIPWQLAWTTVIYRSTEIKINIQIIVCRICLTVQTRVFLLIYLQVTGGEDVGEKAKNGTILKNLVYCVEMGKKGKSEASVS